MMATSKKYFVENSTDFMLNDELLSGHLKAFMFAKEFNKKIPSLNKLIEYSQN
jgi:hypothetical protein